MSYRSKYKIFIVHPFEFDEVKQQVEFRYSFDDEVDKFTEVITFQPTENDYDKSALKKSLNLSAILVGTSYYKAFPAKQVVIKGQTLDNWQAQFFNLVYQEGLSQFAFENELTRAELAQFKADDDTNASGDNYQSNDDTPLVLQSGGKDSLLLAQLLEKANRQYTPWFMQNSNQHPQVLDSLKFPLSLAQRKVDIAQLEKAASSGGLNGHVPVTYIVLSLAVAQSILLGKNKVIAAIGNEGEEPHAHIGDLAVSHQWSKTWLAEQQMAKYINDYVAEGFKIGSALRKYSELKIAELFVENCWEKYKYEFSSCNRANYMQGMNNQTLQWCGDCPKCANSFLLFAPFVAPDDLITVFTGQNLFEKPSLQDTFKGLLDVDGVMKPFECVGETTELQLAYHMAHVNYPDQYKLPFTVPESKFDYNKTFPHQTDLEV